MEKEIDNNKKLSLKERMTQASKKKWIKMFIADILVILFVLWTGYYLLLLLIPLFFDSYITKYIPWAFWKKSKDKSFKKGMEWVDAILFALVAVYFINTFFFQNYQIPSSSLEKSLLVGDFLCVSKMSYGTRSPMTPFSFPLVQHTLPLLNIKSYLDKPQVDYRRFPGGEQVKRGDIVVFNFPAGDTVATKMTNPDYHTLVVTEPGGRNALWNNKEKYGDIVYRPVDRRENFVKRAIGLPGETIEIRNDSTFIDGKLIKDPEHVQFSYMVQTDGTSLSKNLLDELGISNEDKSKIGFIRLDDPNQGFPKDSASLEQMGFKWNNGNIGLILTSVNLPNDKAEELRKKPFIKSVVRSNKVYKKAGYLSSMPFYPIDYKVDPVPGNFPKLWIPKKGDVLKFDKDVDYKVSAYNRVIRNYEHNDFDYRDGKVYINGKEADEYTFKYDYYFMMGDNRDYSADSRFWGFVPEDHIVGKPLFVWLSLDPDKGLFNGKIRWNRLFTSAAK